MNMSLCNIYLHVTVQEEKSKGGCCKNDKLPCSGQVAKVKTQQLYTVVPVQAVAITGL